MKKNILILAGLALLAAPLTVILEEEASAYSSNAGADPDRSGIGDGSSSNLGGDVETKAIKKSATSGSSQALVPGLIVGYDATAADGYTVTRAVPQTELGQKTLACVTVSDVASGDSGYHRCITKGFARVRYNGTGTKAPAAGLQICATADGHARACDLGSAVEATANTGIRALESKSGSGTDLKVLINLQ